MFVQRPSLLSSILFLSLLASPVFADDDKKCKDDDGKEVKCGPFANKTKMIISIISIALAVIAITCYILSYIFKKKEKKKAAEAEAANGYPQMGQVPPQGQMPPQGQYPQGAPGPYQTYYPQPAYAPPAGHPPSGHAPNPFADPSQRV